jgi:hypothetical protein
LEKMLGLIRGAHTVTGLKVTASRTHKSYPLKVKVSNPEFAQIKIRHHATCPSWNYTISPRGP